MKEKTKSTFKTRAKSQITNFWYNNIKHLKCEAAWGTFKEYKETIGPRKSSKHFLRKINEDAPATPDNVEWTTRKPAFSRSCRYMVGEKSLRSICKTHYQYCATMHYAKELKLDTPVAFKYAVKPRAQKTKIRRAALASYLKGGME